MSVNSGKNATAAVILSFILPGLGQFYVNNIGKGIMFLILYLVAWGLNVSVVGLVFGIPLGLFIWIWSMVAAYNACK